MKKTLTILLILTQFLTACGSGSDRITSPTEKPSFVSPIQISDEMGNVQLSNFDGSNVILNLEDRSGQKVANTQVASVADESGILVLIVPSEDSDLLPTYNFIDSSQTMESKNKLAAPSTQTAITMYIDSVEDSDPIHQTEVPRGLLDDLWNSPGWERTVKTTHEWCERFSTLSDYMEIAEISYDVSIAYITRMSLKTLVKKLALSLGSISSAFTEGAIELCLAATGDPLGLTNLTGVVHDGLGYEMVITDDPLNRVAGGIIVDYESRQTLPNTLIASLLHEARSNENGLFFIPVSRSEPSELTVQRDGYRNHVINIEVSSDGFIELGEVEMIPNAMAESGGNIPGGECAISGEMPSQPYDPFDACNVVQWVIYAINYESTDAWVEILAPYWYEYFVNDQGMSASEARNELRIGPDMAPSLIYNFQNVGKSADWGCYLWTDQYADEYEGLLWILLEGKGWNGEEVWASIGLITEPPNVHWDEEMLPSWADMWRHAFIFEFEYLEIGKDIDEVNAFIDSLHSMNLKTYPCSSQPPATEVVEPLPQYDYNNYDQFVEAVNYALMKMNVDLLGELLYDPVNEQHCSGGICTQIQLSRQQVQQDLSTLLMELSNQYDLSTLSITDIQGDVSCFPLPPAVADHTIIAESQDQSWSICLGFDHLDGRYYISDVYTQTGGG